MNQNELKVIKTKNRENINEAIYIFIFICNLYISKS